MCLFGGWIKFQKISQIVVKHGDLPWDRIRKKSPTKQMEEMGPMTN